MLAPDYLDHAPDRLTLLWQQAEDDILRDVARRIGKMDALTPTANWQLWRYQQTEAVRKDVVKLLARYTGKSEAEIRRLMQEAATAALEAEDEIYFNYKMRPHHLKSPSRSRTCSTRAIGRRQAASPTSPPPRQIPSPGLSSRRWTERGSK